MNAKSSKVGRRWLVVIAVAVAAIVGALFYMAPWEGSKPGSVAEGRSTVAPAATADTGAGSAEAVLAKTATAKTQQLTAEEKAAVQRQIDGAKAEVARLRKMNRKFLTPSEDGAGRAEFVNVEAFSAEQIDAFYTFLTKQGDAFEPGSTAALAFRKQADALVYEMRKYPRMAVKKMTPKSPGLPFFTVMKLAEGTPFPVVESGRVTVSGRNRMLVPRAGIDDPIWEDLFADSPEGK